MLDKCANPACSAVFRSLYDGKLFVTEVKPEHHGDVTGQGRQRLYFWLCNSCYRNLTVTVENGKIAQVVPLPEPATASRAAS